MKCKIKMSNCCVYGELEYLQEHNNFVRFLGVSKSTIGKKNPVVYFYCRFMKHYHNAKQLLIKLQCHHTPATAHTHTHKKIITTDLLTTF